MRHLAILLPFVLVACGGDENDCERDNTCAIESAGTGGQGGAAGNRAGTAGSTGTVGAEGGAGGQSGSGGEAGAPASGGRAGAPPVGGAGGLLSTGGSAIAGGAAGAAGSTGAGGEGGASGDAGAGGAAGEGGTASDPCATALPDEDLCAIDERFGIFVSPDGDDVSGQGTREAPFATLTRGIEAAIAADKRVYACATQGPYAETLVLDATATGLALFGGFDCEQWSYRSDSRARIEGGTMAVKIDAASKVMLSDLDIVAADAAAPGESSIALFAANAGLVLERVMLTAGAGAAGEDGELVEFVEGVDWPAMEVLAGNAATVDAAGAACTYATCPGGGETEGGAGADPDDAPAVGLPGSALPEPLLSDMGQGGIADACDAGGEGGPGSPGAPGNDGTGAVDHGTLTASGWTAASGLPGSPGGPGQGGGGGASLLADEGGGSGGCGACGGNGATPGTGGGSSIALLSHRSSLTLSECTLASRGGADGGAGRAGQDGQHQLQVGGDAGSAGAFACAGGVGGRGGPGGASGGGAGGLSVGIVYSGSEPSCDAATLGAITTSTPGNGGAGVPDVADTAGVSGVNEAILDVSSP